MKIKLYILQVFLLLGITIGCSKEDSQSIAQEFVVAFESSDASFAETDTSKEVMLVFSNTATESGTITIEYTETGVVYGTDYTINTEGSGVINLSYSAGDEFTSFTVYKLQDADVGETKEIDFTITELSASNGVIQGNTTFKISFTEVATLGAVISPEVGGPNEPNQVYVDLSLQFQTAIQRDAWDLGFYTGDEFAVKINGAIYMGVAQLDAVDINSITESDVTDLKDLIVTNAANTAVYFDDPSGDITQTAIENVSITANENKVYLLKLGYEISDETPAAGAVSLTGDVRGWKKIRVLQNGSDYTLQYADLDDTTHKEITITKNSDYNFTFFSFDSESEVTIEPTKTQWDLNFTVFTNILDFGEGVLGGYGYSDFIVTNIHGGASSYEVLTDDFTYADFTESDVDNTLFTQDQTTIGSNWRSVFSGLTLADRFYVLKDTDGNLYKIRFNALVNDRGERGYPSFDYIKLN